MRRHVLDWHVHACPWHSAVVLVLVTQQVVTVLEHLTTIDIRALVLDSILLHHPLYLFVYSWQRRREGCAARDMRPVLQQTKHTPLAGWLTFMVWLCSSTTVAVKNDRYT